MFIAKIRNNKLLHFSTLSDRHPTPHIEKGGTARLPVWIKPTTLLKVSFSSCYVLPRGGPLMVGLRCKHCVRAQVLQSVLTSAIV